ncbi:MAG: 4-hydroxyphenylacetate 3-hydroxylase family protein [Leptothrix sp. (in: b-proteobacteria)]
MPAAAASSPARAPARLMSAADYRESLRRYTPTVYVNGERIDSVADAPSLQPGINALGVSYDFARRPELARQMTAVQTRHGRSVDGVGIGVNRMLHVNESTGDLLNKLEAVRLLCQETGCAQRYLAHDALNALAQVSARLSDATGRSDHVARFEAYLAHAQDEDLSIGIAMTDAKGDRSRRPHQQANPDTYVHVVERNARGIVISGTKAIVTGAPYMHELLVMPSRAMTAADADFAVCCAVPIDAPGLTLVSRPAGRPGDKLENGAALFSRRHGQATAVCLFDRVFVPWERVFYSGQPDEVEHSQVLTYSYATHHRHSCIAARAGFGDLLIGAGALMSEANGFDPGQTASLREPMVELIKITEGFYACGVAASVYGTPDPHAGNFMPEPVFSNIGKLLLATQIYDMHRLAHEVSGGLIVALPGPDEDHNPATAATLAEVLRASPDVPYDKRIEVARFIEDLTASHQGGWYSVISLHGGGSPAAMKQEIWRQYPVGDKVDLVERLLDRGVLAPDESSDAGRAITRNRSGGLTARSQPGQCCDTGCRVPGAPVPVALPESRRTDGDRA